jgi:hypothetical protein
MSAFESFPVHCLKRRPSGNRRRPGKAGTVPSLEYARKPGKAKERIEGIPPIDVVNDGIGLSFRVIGVDVVDDPLNHMILERSLDELMQKIRCNELVNVGTGKVARERLADISIHIL